MLKLPALAVLLLAASSAAQMPLPPYGSTYSWYEHSRGFYFQAPIAFHIHAVRVPDEQGFGLQNVAIYTMPSAPPTYAAVTSGGLQFVATLLPSNQLIPADVHVQAGEWVGVLGGCGNSTAMLSSYGTGGFQSNVLGYPVTLYRLLSQNNICTSSGNVPYSSGGTGSIGRVEIHVDGQSSAAEYGSGNGGGWPAPTLATAAMPILGTRAALAMTQFDPSAIRGILVGGLTRSSLTLGSWTFLVGSPYLFALDLGAPAPGTPVTMNFQLPGLPGPAPIPAIDFQAIVLLPGGGLALTNGVEWQIGY